jgi:hypothetical protein
MTTKAATVCHRCHRIRPCGCPTQDDRRHANNLRLGRKTAHWIQTSRNAISRAFGYCPQCGRAEDENDPSTKLTADLIGGGDHSKATLAQVRVLCRRCHGTEDGGRRVF